MMFGCGLWLVLILPTVTCVENLAVQKPVWMSSVLNEVYGKAEHAVAGTNGTTYPEKDCSHAATDDQAPWFIVDLLGEYYIHNVTLYNRGDCCGQQFNNFVIEIFTTNPTRCPSAEASVCTTYPGTLGIVDTLVCDMPVLGRFVQVRMNQAGVLVICEIEVYGQRKECGEVHHTNIPNKRLTSTEMTTSTLSSTASCVSQCALSGACVGVNYNHGSGTCELLARPESTDTVSSDPDWSYIGNDLC